MNHLARPQKSMVALPNFFFFDPQVTAVGHFGSGRGAGHSPKTVLAHPSQVLPFRLGSYTPKWYSQSFRLVRYIHMHEFQPATRRYPHVVTEDRPQSRKCIGGVLGAMATSSELHLHMISKGRMVAAGRSNIRVSSLPPLVPHSGHPRVILRE